MTQEELDAAKEALTREFPVPHDNDKLLLFLYAKGVAAGADVQARLAKFSAVLEQPGDGNKPVDRLNRLLLSAGDAVPAEGSFQTFDAAIGQLGKWDSDVAFVFHRDHERVRAHNVLVQRVQRSGLCYLHAPDVVQHYAVALGSMGTNCSMLDLRAFIRKKYSGPQVGALGHGALCLSHAAASRSRALSAGRTRLCR